MRMTCGVPSQCPPGETPRTGASLCLTYLMIGPIDVRRASVASPDRFALRRPRRFESGLPSDRSLVSPGLEAREQVVRTGPPWSRVAAAALGLVEPRDLLVPGRERVVVLESGDHLDGLEEVRFRLRPVPALREDEAEVRLRRRQGDGVADRLGELDRALGARGRSLDRFESKVVLDRVRQSVRGETHVPGPQGDLRRPGKGLRRGPRVAFAARDNPEIDLDRGILPRAAPDRRGGL